MAGSVKKGFHHKLNKLHDTYRKHPHIQTKHRAAFYGVILGVLLATLTVVGLYMATYGDKASPSTYLSGVDVSGKTRSEIKFSSHNLLNKIRVEVTNGETSVTANAEDLGIKLRDDDTAAAAIDAGTGRNIFIRFNPFIRKDAKLVVDYDLELMQNFLNEKFYDVTTPPAEPIIAYNDTNLLFNVIPGTSGKVISAEQLARAIDDNLANEAGAMRLDMKLSDISPIVSSENAEIARDYINQRLGIRLNMYHNKRLMYFVDPPDIASFAVFTPNPETHQFDVTYNEGTIKEFIDKKLAPSLTSAPVNEKLLVDKNGQTLMTLSKGRNGLAPGNIDSLVSRIVESLANNQTLNIELDLTEKQYETEKIVTEDNRWVEYNLSTFTVTLWDGSTAVWSTNQTANGKPSTPTITGVFRVFQKLSVQTMTGGTAGAGDFYSIPGVKWVTYWGPGGYAFHTASWLGGQVGTRISHGCVNMFESDALMVYNYVDIGTRVVVHW